MMFEKLADVSYIAHGAVKGEIKAVVLNFHGLGMTGMHTSTPLEEMELAAHGALNVYPYFGPWSWMNRGSRALVDEIVRRVYVEYALADAVPLILRGGSMGGHAALNYTRYAKKIPAAVECNCPVTDPKFHESERSDLPRTFLLAYGMYGEPIDQVFTENSPMAQVQNMPRVPYLIIHGTEDKAVNKQAHSDRFVAAMRAAGHQIEYVEAQGMGHCAFVDFQVFRRYQTFALDVIGK